MSLRTRTLVANRGSQEANVFFDLHGHKAG